MAKERRLEYDAPASYQDFMYVELFKTLIDQNDKIIEQNEKIIKALQPQTTEKTAKTNTKDSTKE
jgi:6-phosphogluconolactonase/glucosamine-6-phosphate isomerase/deaminase